MNAFRKQIKTRDDQIIDLLSIDGPQGNLALKASDAPVVLNREQACELIDAVAEAFDLGIKAMPNEKLWTEVATQLGMDKAHAH
jgi:hypothetical protein